MICFRSYLFAFFSLIIFFNPQMSWSATSFEEICNSQLGAPELIMEVRKNDAHVEKVSSAYLQDAHASALAAIYQSGAIQAVVHGTVESRLKSGGSVLGTVLRDRASGQACARPGVKIELEYAHFKLLLSERLKEGSCEHSEVHDHERRHVDAYNLALDQAEEAVKAKWASEWSQRGPIFGTVDDLSEKAADLRDEVANFAFNHAVQVADQLNREIDTMSEYKRMGMACNGALIKASR